MNFTIISHHFNGLFFDIEGDEYIDNLGITPSAFPFYAVVGEIVHIDEFTKARPIIWGTLDKAEFLARVKEHKSIKSFNTL